MVNPDGTVGRPGVDFTLLFVDGHVINIQGTGYFSGRLHLNDASGAVFGSGLHNPHGAEIHYVLRDHGPALKDIVREQITTGNGGCSNFGGGGDYVCVDFQIAFYNVPE